MDVDAVAATAANERHTIPSEGAKNIGLSARPQQMQLEMDWEQISWARSVKASDHQIKVTVKFT